jgi:hypothetical protein
MKVFPVRYEWNDGSDKGTYYIVADTIPQAEEIAYGCIAANIHPQPEANERPAHEGRAVAKIWVMESWAAETKSDRIGLLGTGSERYNARAYAEYVKTTGKFR